MTCEAHPLPEAMAAAVPGPPMAALEAVRSACSHSALSHNAAASAREWERPPWEERA